MKKPALIAAVAALSILAATSAQAAADGTAASDSQQQTNAGTPPVKLDASADAAMPDSKELRGQVTAHRTDAGDIASDAEDDDTAIKK